MTASSTSPTGGRFDAIVIGSGAAGMSCATTLARAGMQVLLAEKNEWFGGYSHGFAKDGFYWDHGGHIFLAYRLGAQARKVFQRLEIDKIVEMVPDQHDYRCVFPDDSLALPAEMTEAADILAARFPEEREGIARVLLIMEALIEEVDAWVPSFRVASRPGERRWMDPFMEQFQRPLVGRVAGALSRVAPLPARNLLRYQQATFKQLLDDHLKSRRLKGFFSMLAVGIATPPAELSAVIAGVFFIHALRTMWMPRGGFGKLGQALVEMFQERGGTLATGAEVTRILTEDGRVTGIETRDGRRFSAPAVVSAGDARRTFLELIDPAVVPTGLRERLPHMATTRSFFQVQIGADMDLSPYRQDIKRLNFIYPYDDIDRAMANFPNGNVEEAAFYLYVATFHQPEMAPPGQHSIKLECPTTLDSRGINWDADKEKIADVFVRRAEQIIPDLGKHIVVRNVRTPLDLLRDTYNSDGAFAGWAFSPELLSRGRPQQRTPVPGLYLAGHWTTPSAGVPWVMLSGYNTAGMVIADAAKRRPAPATTG